MAIPPREECPFSVIISAIFRTLEEENVPYVVLRNYEALPEQPGTGMDVDVLVSDTAWERFHSIVDRIICESGWQIMIKHRRFVDSKAYFVPKHGTAPIFHIDGCRMLAVRSFNFVDGSFVLNRRILHKNGFYIPPPGAEASILFIKELLGSLPVKQKYRSRIQEFVKQDAETFTRALSANFGDRIAEEMLDICKEGRWDEAFASRRRFWKYLVLQNLTRQPIGQVFRLLGYLTYYLCDKVRFSRGIFVAFIGPDGVGKSTVCQAFLQAVSKSRLFAHHQHYYHWRFSLLPKLGRFFPIFSPTRVSGTSNAARDPEMTRPQAFLRLVYYGLDHVLSWPWVLWARSHEHLLCFDRYFDYMIQTPYLQLPSWFVQAVARVIPHPDLVFMLRADPRTIHYRKSDLDLDEIERQLNAFQNGSISSHAQTVVLDTEEPLDSLIDQVMSEVVEVLKK